MAKQFALVHNGYLLHDAAGLPEISSGRDGAPTEFHPTHPAGCVWWPVVERDSQAFDNAKHWRLKPVYFAEDGEVVRLYPVVSKSGELS